MEIRINLFSFLVFAHLSEFRVASQYFRIIEKGSFTQEESPLILTPFLEDGSIIDAREKARVQHSEIKDVESYSGYFTVNKNFNSNLFFWYFPSKDNSSTDPLILWLQGGPGTTSLFGHFNENGPFEVTERNTLQLRNFTWVNNHNVLYIDSPVGTGFSFTDDEADYATSFNDVAFNLYIVLHQFFILFPELRKNEFYVMGESSAGKYVHTLSYVIHKANEIVNVENKINLAGLAVGNGFADPINQLEFPEYLYQIGLVDENGRGIVREYVNNISDLMRKEKYIESSELFSLLFIDNGNYPTLFQNLTGFSFFYNYLKDKEPESLNWFKNWLRQPNVRRALHVGDNGFVPFSKKVFQNLAVDINKSLAVVISALLEHYRVLLYFGQVDIALPISISRKFLQKLRWSGSEEYKKVARNQWFVENDLAGYTKCADNLIEVLIRNAGHMAPADQPLWAWTMISYFTRHKPLC